MARTIAGFVATNRDGTGLVRQILAKEKSTKPAAIKLK
jgi:hypothetical protein